MHNNDETFAWVRCLKLAVIKDETDQIPITRLRAIDIAIPKRIARNRSLEKIMLKHFHYESHQAIVINGKIAPMRTIAFRPITEQEYGECEWDPCHQGNTFIVRDFKGRKAERIINPNLPENLDPADLGLTCPIPIENFEAYKLFFKSNEFVRATGYSSIPVPDMPDFNIQFPIYPGQSLLDRKTRKLYAMVGPAGEIVKFPVRAKNHDLHDNRHGWRRTVVQSDYTIH